VHVDAKSYSFVAPEKFTRATEKKFTPPAKKKTSSTVQTQLSQVGNDSKAKESTIFC